MQTNNVDDWPVQHRPWPLPDSPWVMYQEWHDLLFAHWPVPESELRLHVPSCFPIDQHSGTAWLGITPFRLEGARARLLPAVPGLSSFPELNVRTYVTVGGKPGVYFFSLDAGNPAAVAGARAFYHLPYHAAEMHVAFDGPWVRYSSRRLGIDPGLGEFRAAYRPMGEPFVALQGSLEHFLAERYCLYTVDSAGDPYRCEIHHPPWQLQAADAAIEANTVAGADGILLPARQPLVHYSRLQPTIVWAPERIPLAEWVDLGRAA